jgi:hypothetical protein
MNSVSFINPAVSLLNKVAINPQPLPPKESTASNLWSAISPGVQSAPAKTGGSVSSASFDDDYFCGTRPPGPVHPGGPVFPNIGVLQGNVQFA